MSQNPAGTGPMDHDEMESLLAVRQELGPTMEPALVDSFAQKILAEVQRQTHINSQTQQQSQMEQSRTAQQSGTGGRLTLAIVSLVMSIPLTAIALGLSSVWMAAIVWLGIVMINFAYGTERRGKS